MRFRAVLADAEPIPARVVRGCIAMAFTARVRAVACIPRLADTIKCGELSCMTLALDRERTACRSSLMGFGAVLADVEPTAARVVRGCIAMAFTARVRAVACTRRHPR